MTPEWKHRQWALLHRLADRMEDRLRRIFTAEAREGMDTDDLRLAYEDWCGLDDLTRRYDRVANFVEGAA